MTHLDPPDTRRAVAVEDDAEMRQLIAWALGRRGWRVTAFGDGASAVDHLVRSARDGSPPQLVVTDVRLPGLTGFEVLISAKDALPDLPVVVITAFGDASTHTAARELGALAVLDKPFELADLVALAEAAVPSPPSRSQP